MSETNAALAYIASRADRVVPLTILRITTLLYMSDWRSAIQNKHQISDVRWVQPFVMKAVELRLRLAEEFPSMTIDPLTDALRLPPAGSVATVISPAAKECIDFVLKSESENGWLIFFKLAYSTFPMLSQPERAELDLVLIANQYSQRPELQRVG